MWVTRRKLKLRTLTWGSSLPLLPANTYAPPGFCTAAQTATQHPPTWSLSLPTFKRLPSLRHVLQTRPFLLSPQPLPEFRLPPRVL